MTPYFKTNLGKIICADCFNVFPEIEDKSVNLIIADYPYNIKKDKWDNIKNYEEWMGKQFLQAQRVLKDNGSFYWFHNDMSTVSKLMVWLEENTEFVFKNLITWYKISPDFKNYGFAIQRLSNGTSRNYYGGFTEYILYYTFQDETGLTTVMLDTNNFPTLRQYFKDYQEALGLTKLKILELVGQRADHCFRWGSSQWDMPTSETYEELGKLPIINEFVRREYEDLRQEYEDLRQEYEDLRYTFNVQQVLGDVNNNANVWLYPPEKSDNHITPKPLNLIKNIIKHSSNEGDLILDPTAGVCTTGLAAEQLNRNWLCIEKELEYCEKGKGRF